MSFIGKVSGSSVSHGLRHRIFSLFLFFGGVASLFDLAIRIFFNQHFNQIIFSVLVCGVFIVTYYFVRVKSIFTYFIVFVSAIFTVVTLSISFFFNSGTDGKVIPLLLFSLVVYFLSSRRPGTYYISAIHLISITTVLLLQFFHPEWVVYYPNEKERLIDNLANIIYIVLIMYFILNVIRNEFEKERANLRSKDHYLNQQNELIQELLKELNHRVKNNLQVISALLSLQAYRSQDPNAVSALVEGKNRLESMSILHKKLYQDSFFNQVSLAEYIDDLIEHVLSDMEPPFKIKKDIEDITLTVDQAIPLGLILNEVFTNIKRYASKSYEHYREMQILGYMDNAFVLVFIKDNVDLLEDNKPQQDASELGMELIDMLINQLDGTVEILSDSRNGTEIRIKFTLKY